MAKSDSRRGSINARLRKARQDRLIEDGKIDLALGYTVPVEKIDYTKPTASVSDTPQQVEVAFI